ncbi:MAG: SDR family NAD(P)-dependent oxidoreductase [Bacteroidota bacterium]
MPSKKISIIGCGWLGLPTAKMLVESGNEVIGTTTREARLAEIEEQGIRPILLQLTNKVIECDNHQIWRADTFIVAIPPGVRHHGRDYHIGQIKLLLEKLPELAHLIYVSSTSVYPSLAGTYDESFALAIDTTGNRTLFGSEQLILSRKKTTILRCGGLMGANRVSGRYFAGKQVSGEKQPVNYIHQIDAAKIITKVAESELTGIYNLVAPEHPLRPEVYKVNSQLFGFEMSSFKDDGINRIIEGNKITERLSYDFEYPDPRHFHS